MTSDAPHRAQCARKVSIKRLVPAACKSVPDATQTACFSGQGVGGYVHTHAADHDRHQLEITQIQAMIVHSRHDALPPSVSGDRANELEQKSLLWDTESLQAAESQR